MLLYLVTGLVVYRAAKRYVKMQNDLLDSEMEVLDLTEKNWDLDIKEFEERMLLQDMGGIIADNHAEFVKVLDKNPWTRAYDYGTINKVKEYYDRIGSEEKEEGS